MASTSKNIMLGLDVHKHSFDNAQNHRFNDLPKFVDASGSVALEQLTEKAERQQKKINNICLLKHLIADCHNVLSWINGIKMDILTDKIASDIDGAKAILTRHQEYKNKINIYENNVKNVTAAANQLIKKKVCFGEVEEKLIQLSSSWNSLLSLWEKRHAFHKQRLDLYLFYSKVDEVSAWVTDQEVMLSANKHPEYSLSSLENLINSQEYISTTLVAKEVNIKHLAEFAAKLVGEKHYASEDISNCRHKFLERYVMLKELLLDQCDLDWSELKAWIDQKLKCVGKNWNWTYMEDIENCCISKADHRMKLEDAKFEAQRLNIARNPIACEIAEEDNLNCHRKPGSNFSAICKRSPADYKNKNAVCVQDLYKKKANNTSKDEGVVSNLSIGHPKANASFVLTNEIINKRSEILARAGKLKASLISKNCLLNESSQVIPNVTVDQISNRQTPDINNLTHATFL